MITAISLAAAYAAMLGCVVTIFRCWAATAKVQQQTAQMERRAARSAEDRAFVVWAGRTMLTVTNREGYVQACTLHQLYSSGFWDNVWDAPIAVSTWNADPEVIDRYSQELAEEHRRA